MMLFWIFLGVLMASSLWYMYTKVLSGRKMPMLVWILSVASVLWGGFTLAWVASSLIEGEVQAAGMGLLVFGIVLMGLVIITRVKIIGKKPLSGSKAKINA